MNKKPLSIRLDPQLHAHVKDKANMSRYIEKLVKDDVHANYKRKITEVVKEELLKDESFFNELSERLSDHRGVDPRYRQ